MLTIVLALGAALLYGLSDFLGGFLSRRASAWAVAVVTQVAALGVMALAATIRGGAPTTEDLVWGGIAGLGSGAGTAFLYRGLSGGRMSVVAPLSAVGAALVPVAVGALTGERPSVVVWAGIAVAFPAIWLIATTPEAADAAAARSSRRSDVTDGVLAGLGFGLMFAALGQVADEAGLAPLVATAGTSIVAIVVLAMLMRQAWAPRERASLGGAIVGALAAGAAILFLFATQAGLLAVASVITSLYPAFTVLLAAVVLHERVRRSQAVGLGLAMLAVGMIAGG